MSHPDPADQQFGAVTWPTACAGLVVVMAGLLADRPEVQGARTVARAQNGGMATRVQVVIDCADPERLATFWGAALGYRMQDPPTGFATWPDFLRSIDVPESEWNSASAVVDPEGIGPRVYLQRVPEPKATKNRLHLDLNVGGGTSVPLDDRKQRIGAEAERLVGLGATIIEPREQHGEYWVVMQDPEGNEFCLQ